MLDLFSGLGGWSAPWKAAGHHVLTCDIATDLRPDFPCSVEDLPITALPPIDVILASPPCTEFSRWTMRGMCPGLRHRTVLPPSLDLVRATKRLIDVLRPRWWVVENVHGSTAWINPILGPHQGAWAGRYLWANFDLFVRPFTVRAKSSWSSGRERESDDT